MKVETIRCDNCDKARDKDTNHWSTVLGLSSGENTAVVTAQSLPFIATGQTAFGLTTDCTADACGDECRFALISRYLSTGKFKRAAVQDTIKAGR